MGQKIFLRMWCRVNFYCTERVIYHVNTMKKKELIFYMMHEMRIVWYLQLGICLFFFLSPVFCLMCHSLFDPWPRKMSYYQKKKYIVWIYFAFPSEMYKKKTKQTQASPHVDSNFSIIFFQSHNFVDAVNRWHISGGAVCDCTGLDKFKLHPCSRFTL